MCGIVAARSSSADVRFAVERGLAAIAHRGPDGMGAKTIGPVTLGHARLAILDPSAASNQPFTYGTTTVVLNGEIWNFRELRSSLIEKGLRFSTSGDVEVLAAVLDLYGTSGLRMLEGMFAIAWTDGNNLWAGRDRFGEAPLHICPEHRMVGSELKALMAAGAPAQLIRWVPPGFVVELSGEPRWERWYSAPRAMVNLDRGQAATRLRSLLGAGCVERSLADVPVCTLLSGGIDSSAIAYLARGTFPDLVAYTAVFDPHSPDLSAAREAADSLGIALREVKIEAPSADDLKSVVEAIEMPFKAQIEIGWACLRLAGGDPVGRIQGGAFG